MPRVILGGDHATQVAGVRDKWVTVQQKTAGTGPSGFPVDTWTTLAGMFMSREDLMAEERYTAAQESAAMESRWQMPYRSDCDPDLVDVPNVRRLQYGVHTYDIKAASLVGRRRGIELITLAKVG